MRIWPVGRGKRAVKVVVAWGVKERGGGHLYRSSIVRQGGGAGAVHEDAVETDDPLQQAVLHAAALPQLLVRELECLR